MGILTTKVLERRTLFGFGRKQCLALNIENRRLCRLANMTGTDVLGHILMSPQMLRTQADICRVTGAASMATSVVNLDRLSTEASLLWFGLGCVLFSAGDKINSNEEKYRLPTVFGVLMRAAVAIAVIKLVGVDLPSNNSNLLHWGVFGVGATVYGNLMAKAGETVSN